MSRTPERINNITEKIRFLWHRLSDMRFGQFLENFVFANGIKNHCVFNLEDDEVEFVLDMMLTENDKGFFNRSEFPPGKIYVNLEKDKKRLQETKIPFCITCQKSFVKESEYTWKAECACVSSNLRISMG
ncbi:MAG: hypothetical protein Q8O88_00870 [bacterium]|nr:hypothetical protein [bacterium]